MLVIGLELDLVVKGTNLSLNLGDKFFDYANTESSCSFGISLLTFLCIYKNNLKILFYLFCFYKYSEFFITL